MEAPGLQTFNNAGVFTVTFTVTDSFPSSDPTPATVQITVNVPGNQEPNGVIDTPVGNQTINVGDSIAFTGTGTDPDNNLPLTFDWDFGPGSGISDSTVEDPGLQTFNNAGVFTVTFTVTDSFPSSDPTPATVQITVNVPGNQEPNGVIDTPVGNQTINVGDSIDFTGTGTDPDNNLPLTFDWDFGPGSGIFRFNVGGSRSADV